MKDIIGIDLGTSSWTVAIYNDGRPTILTASAGSDPSSPATRDQHGEPLANRTALRRVTTAPADALSFLIQLLGRQFDEAVVQMAHQRQAKQAFIIHRGEEDSVAITIPGSERVYTPEEMVALILRRLKHEAESYQGTRISRAVLTVPANLNDDQRQAMRRAADEAGLTVPHILDAPTAAALAYGNSHKRHNKLLVVDLDRGHYDVSVLEIDGETVTVLATDGDATLGHEVWASRIADYLVDAFLRRHGVDLRHDAQAVLRLHLAAEEAGALLPQQDRAIIDLPFITSGAHGPRHLDTILTRQAYDTETAPLKARLAVSVKDTLRAAGLEAAALDGVLLLGNGAGSFSLRDTVRTLMGGVPVIEDGSRSMAALGAALQTARMPAGDDHTASQNMTRIGLGLETVGGLMVTMIPRDTPVPARRTELFSTSEDGRTDIEIHVLQGERPMADDNRKLGVVHLKDFPAAPRGMPQIEVTFQLDTTEQLRVTARDLATDASHTLSINMDEFLSEREVQRLLTEAQRHEADDVRRRTLAEAQNLGRQTIYQTRRSLQHLNGVSDRAGCQQTRREIEEKLGSLQKAVEAQDVKGIRSLADDIQDANNVLNHLAYGQVATNDTEEKARHDTKKQNAHTRIVVEKL